MKLPITREQDVERITTDIKDTITTYLKYHPTTKSKHDRTPQQIPINPQYFLEHKTIQQQLKEVDNDEHAEDTIKHMLLGKPTATFLYLYMDIEHKTGKPLSQVFPQEKINEYITIKNADGTTETNEYITEEQLQDIIQERKAYRRASVEQNKIIEKNIAIYQQNIQDYTKEKQLLIQQIAIYKKQIEELKKQIEELKKQLEGRTNIRNIIIASIVIVTIIAILINAHLIIKSKIKNNKNKTT